MPVGCILRSNLGWSSIKRGFGIDYFPKYFIMEYKKKKKLNYGLFFYLRRSNST